MPVLFARNWLWTITVTTRQAAKPRMLMRATTSVLIRYVGLSDHPYVSAAIKGLESTWLELRGNGANARPSLVSHFP